MKFGCVGLWDRELKWILSLALMVSKEDNMKVTWNRKMFCEFWGWISNSNKEDVWNEQAYMFKWDLSSFQVLAHLLL